MLGTRRWIVTVCLLFSIGVSVGCSRKREGRDLSLQPEIRLAYIAANADLPVYVAQELKLFKKHDLRISLLRTNNSSEALTALLTGQADAVGGLTFGVYFPAELEDPDRFALFQPFAETDSSIMSHIVVPRGSTIRQLSDLRGRRIGTYSGASQLVFLKLFLKAIGLDPDHDVTIIQVGMDLQVQALQAGQYDALFTVEPYGSTSLTTIGAEVLIANPRSRYIMNPFWVGASAVGRPFLLQNPDVVSRLVKALDEAADSIVAAPQDTKRILPKYAPIDSATAIRSGLYHWYTLRDSVDLDAIQNLADLMAETSLIKRPLTEVGKLFISEQELR